MARFKNNKEGILGLNFRGDDKSSGARTVNPGEVFEAERADIPEHYFTQGWISETNEKVGQLSAEEKNAQVNPQADARINKQTQGPNPVQGSGTSLDKSETDKAAKESGAYDAHTPGGQLVKDNTDDKKRR